MTTKAKRARGLIAAATLAAAVATGGVKASELAADPSDDKDCGPAGDTSASDSANAHHAAPALPFQQRGGTLNDASCLNRTAVHGVVRITRESELIDALQYARASRLRVAIAGVRHSMGGQAFAKNALVLDMRAFNQITLNEAAKTITVQSGATWHDIQAFLHPRFAVKAMQSTDIFTVGGSIAVNAHGMDHQAGAVGGTIRAMRVLLASGEVVTASPTENRALFDHVVGGYGLFGIVIDATLDIVDNAVYESDRHIMDYADFPAVFARDYAPDASLGLMYAHLSTSPDSLLREMIVYTYREKTVVDSQIAPLGEVSGTKMRRFVLNFSKLGALPMRLKWFAEKHIEPRMETCTVTNRNQAQSSGEACFVSRNDPMHDSVLYLKNDLKRETDILQEYFVPRNKLPEFVDGLRDIVKRRDVNMLNASVRVVHKSDNALSYAPEDAFSVVLYLNQPATPAGTNAMRGTTSALIDLATSLGGRFFCRISCTTHGINLNRLTHRSTPFFKESANLIRRACLQTRGTRNTAASECGRLYALAESPGTRNPYGNGAPIFHDDSNCSWSPTSRACSNARWPSASCRASHVLSAARTSKSCSRSAQAS